MQFHICGEFGGKELRSHLHLVFFEFFTYGKIRKDIGTYGENMGFEEFKAIEKCIVKLEERLVGGQFRKQ